MQFGYNINRQISRGANPKEVIANQIEAATCARECGFDFISVGHRYSYVDSTVDPNESSSIWQFQPLLLLAHIAAELGSSVKYSAAVLTASSLHPVQLAEDIATLDAMCAGGLRLGIAIGWGRELEAFGVEPSTRVRRFEELVIVLRELLTSESVTFDGDFFTVQDARIVARGIQRPSPPIWLGASFDSAVRRAARLGDSWVISSHHVVSKLASQVAIYREELESTGKAIPEERPINRHIYISESRKAAFAEAEAIFTELWRQRGVSGSIALQDRPWEPSEDNETPFIAGDVNDCIKQIAHIRDSLDVNLIILGTRGATQGSRLRAIELLGKEVLPHFKRTNSHN